MIAVDALLHTADAHNTLQAGHASAFKPARRQSGNANNPDKLPKTYKQHV
jgi:hypothetical protein